MFFLNGGQHICCKRRVARGRLEGGGAKGNGGKTARAAGLPQGPMRKASKRILCLSSRRGVGPAVLCAPKCQQLSRQAGLSGRALSLSSRRQSQSREGTLPLPAPTGLSLERPAASAQGKPLAHLQNVVPRPDVCDVNPLAVDVVSVEVPAAHGDALLSEVGTLVALAHICQRRGPGGGWLGGLFCPRLPRFPGQGKGPGHRQRASGLHHCGRECLEHGSPPPIRTPPGRAQEGPPGPPPSSAHAQHPSPHPGSVCGPPSWHSVSSRQKLALWPSATLVPLGVRRS